MRATLNRPQVPHLCNPLYNIRGAFAFVAFFGSVIQVHDGCKEAVPLLFCCRYCLEI